MAANGKLPAIEQIQLSELDDMKVGQLYKFSGNITHVDGNFYYESCSNCGANCYGIWRCRCHLERKEQITWAFEAKIKISDDTGVVRDAIMFHNDTSSVLEVTPDDIWDLLLEDKSWEDIQQKIDQAKSKLWSFTFKKPEDGKAIQLLFVSEEEEEKKEEEEEEDTDKE